MNCSRPDQGGASQTRREAESPQAVASVPRLERWTRYDRATSVEQAWADRSDRDDRRRGRGFQEFVQKHVTGVRCEVGPYLGACPNCDVVGCPERAKYRCVMRDYGGGYREVSAVFCGRGRSLKGAICEDGQVWQRDQDSHAPARLAEIEGEAKRALEEKQEERKKANQDRAIRRARSTVRQKVLTIGADHMVTFTYRENVTDFEKARDDFERLLRLWRKVVPGLQFIAVPERQKRGAWHWHVAVRGRQNVKALRKIWLGVIGSAGGNIDVKGPKGPVAIEGRHRLARYLSKYITKDMGGAERETPQRYTCSKRIKVPCDVTFCQFDPREGLVWWLAQVRGGECPEMWLEGEGRIWGASWDR